MRKRDKEAAEQILAHMRAEQRELRERLQSVENRLGALDAHIEALMKIVKESK